jgi:hypothetical protein
MFNTAATRSTVVNVLHVYCNIRGIKIQPKAHCVLNFTGNTTTSGIRGVKNVVHIRTRSDHRASEVSPCKVPIFAL